MTTERKSADDRRIPIEVRERTDRPQMPWNHLQTYGEFVSRAVGNYAHVLTASHRGRDALSLQVMLQADLGFGQTEVSYSAIWQVSG